MEQKQRFINLAQSGRFTVSELSEEFGITRKTGHKWLLRYAGGGMKGLEERSRAPKKVSNRTSEEVERLIVSEKRQHMTWGPKKIQRVLMIKHGMERLGMNRGDRLQTDRGHGLHIDWGIGAI
jgi:transposase